MLARIVFITGSKAGTVFELPDADLTVGRDLDRDLRFSPNEVLVSARHSKIVCQDEVYILFDDGSTNGTFVNGEKIKGGLQLTNGDIIQFGPGGPQGRYEEGQTSSPPPTLDANTVQSPLAPARSTDPAQVRYRPARSTREMLAVAISRGRRTRRALILVSAGALAAILAIVFFQQQSKANLENALAELSAFLDSERESRSAMAMDLASIQIQADSLRAVVAEEQRRFANDPGMDPESIRRMSNGVALLVFTYGYVEEGGQRLLRYQVGPGGGVVFEPGPGGRPIASLTFGGSGRPVQHQGTATGFLVDSSGLVLTNRHVAEPWAQDGELTFLQSRGLNVAGAFIDIRAYFPPGDQSRRLIVESTSSRADVAVMRIAGPMVNAPTLQLAGELPRTGPGDQLLLIAYPTGLHNLLFRETRAAREQILQTTGDDAGLMAAELAQRRLIQPLITNGGVSDATETEVIHTAATTVGASGGPLINLRGRVVAIHYASVRAPTPGDPFRTQRGVPIRYAWEILPADIRAGRPQEN